LSISDRRLEIVFFSGKIPDKSAYIRTDMSLFVASLNSGSNGNCYYIGNQEEAVLVDAGISCRETEKRLKRLELSIKKVKAIFVTHEHTDHIYGISRLSRKFKIPIYITPETMVQGRLHSGNNMVASFTAFEPVTIGNLTITAFPIHHDACDPHNFIVSGNSVKVGVFTDIGSPCERVKSHFEQCHAAFLEANYDEHMLATGRYPVHLKNRIRGGKGHLSNVQALQLFLQHRPSFMSHLFLSHLSEENNSPKIVERMFRKLAGKTEIIIAPRYEESSLYHIRNVSGPFDNLRRQPVRFQSQLSLF
jgi:phosphoribosyl 1,2-cyclic phosphodiesterase